MRVPRTNLLCTVGTSLFSNLAALAKEATVDNPSKKAAVAARAAGQWSEVASALARIPFHERVCGAEINSIASMLDRGYTSPHVALFFFHSATDDGRAIARILKSYYDDRRQAPVETIEVADLQDDDPKRFRTRGLRNLAREMCRVIRERDSRTCAINATGGYKAQIAIGVVLGQALGIPVYYMHERFTEIIEFPPLPIAFDFELWMRASGLLGVLTRDQLARRSDFEDEWDERYESLVVSEEIDGIRYLDLSPTGQIFHETFRDRFRSARDQVLPPPALARRKRQPTLKGDEGHMRAHHDEIARFLQKVTSEVPQVVWCETNYFNPDLPGSPRFRETRGEVEGLYSDGTWTVKFRVDTTATTDGQRAAVVAALNEWLAER